MSFNQFDSARRGVTEGTVDISTEGTACIAIKLYGSVVWQPMSHVSSSSWTRIRDQAATSIKQKLPNQEKREKANLNKVIHEEHKSYFYELFNKMPTSEKREFIKSHKNSLILKNICVVCMNIATDTKKCIHHNCPGMCNNCWADFEKKESCNCPACNQPQELMCPCCQEMKNKDQLIHASGGCGHAICWSCYGKAFHAKRPIFDCPMCRGEFIRREDDDDLFSDTDSDYSDNDIDLLDEIEPNADGLSHSDIMTILSAIPNGEQINL